MLQEGYISINYYYFYILLEFVSWEFVFHRKDFFQFHTGHYLFVFLGTLWCLFVDNFFVFFYLQIVFYRAYPLSFCPLHAKCAFLSLFSDSSG